MDTDQKTALIAVDHDPGYAPCCYILCRVKNPEAGEGHYDWNTRDEQNTVLVQTDFERPSIARTFGWKPELKDGCEHDGTDGTVDCKSCGKTASEFITEAGEFLDDCVATGKVVEDPGYFE